MSRYPLLPFGLVLLTACGGTAVSHTAEPTVDCALCEKPIPAGLGVSATVGGETRDYRCIHCALTDIHDETADVEIRATTPVDGVVVRLARHAGTWTSSPATTVFLILPERADECLDLHQPFADIDEFDRYLVEHPEIAAESPAAYTIAEYEQIVLAGKPQ